MRTVKGGFFVTYNHPVWSLEEYSDYICYEGMNAMEICNYACMSLGYDEYNPKVYDDMLRAGKRIYCIAADDNHNKRGNGRIDSFGGFVMIKAEKLEYKTITDALVKGNFYASQGPEIKSLYFEDGKIFVKCSDAENVSMVTGRRKADMIYAEDGKLVNEASFDVLPEDGYVRITVTDEKGRHANTSAYFTDELFK